MRTVEEKEAWFKQAMGMSECSLMSLINRQVDNLSMLSMGMLSDAQELLDQPDNPGWVPQINAARQLMNRAKYVIGKQQNRQRSLDRVKEDDPTLATDLSYVIEMAGHRADMWADFAEHGEANLDCFYESDQAERANMSDVTRAAIANVQAWLVKRG